MNRSEINKLIDQMKNNINNFNYSIENINKMVLKVVIQNNNITYYNINGDTRKNILLIY